MKPVVDRMMHERSVAHKRLRRHVFCTAILDVYVGFLYWLPLLVSFVGFLVYVIRPPLGNTSYAARLGAV